MDDQMMKLLKYWIFWIFWTSLEKVLKIVTHVVFNYTNWFQYKPTVLNQNFWFIVMIPCNDGLYFDTINLLIKLIFGQNNELIYTIFILRIQIDHTIRSFRVRNHSRSK